MGIVTVPDARLAELNASRRRTSSSRAAIEFVDIAGLVKGASQGEGLGNKFLTHIREVDAIVQVVRCFEDADIHHVVGRDRSVRDIEVIITELMLADFERVKSGAIAAAKDAKRGDKGALAEEAVLAKIETGAQRRQAGPHPGADAGGAALSAPLFLLTDKPTIFASTSRKPILPRPTRTRT